VQESAARRVDLDWLRIIAFGLLILYHIGMYYVPWDWHVKSEHLLPQLAPVMLATNPWRLALLFLVSGAATHFMLLRRKPGVLARERAKRLLLPLIVGMFLIVPPQSYYEVVYKLGYDEGFWSFYARYLHGDRSFCPNGACIILPTWNHLWFLPYLFVYTMPILAACAWRPKALEQLAARLEGALSGFGVLLWPFLLLAAARVLLAPYFPRTLALAGDWYNHAQYFTVFLFGVLFARSSPVRDSLSRYRWLALALAIASYAVIAGFLVLLLEPGSPARRLANGLIYALNQWTAVAAALGFANLLITRDGPTRRYLTNAIFPYYIVHQTVIIAVAMWLKPYTLPVTVEAALLIGCTAAVCIATYEVVRRLRWLRPFFGLRHVPAPHEKPA
jgi:peptidoglycan/LPS O-acetylase OafA/YrhL